MDNLRVILLFSFAFLSMLIWQAWEQDYGQSRQAAAQAQAAGTSAAVAAGAPAPVSPGEIPSAPAGGVAAPPTAAVSAAQTAKVAVKTDLFSLEIDTQGGTIASLYLEQYPISLDTPEEKFHLLRPAKPNLFIAQSGLVSPEQSKAPTHEALFKAQAARYEMEPGAQSLHVDLVWEKEGVKVTKRFQFTRGSHLISVQHIVENNSGQPWSANEYRQLLRTEGVSESADSQFVYTFTGGAFYTPEHKYEKVELKDLGEKKLDRDVTDGWIAMLQHYFVGAWVPPKGQKERFSSGKVNGDQYIIRAIGPAVAVAPGQSHTFTTGLFAGPKLQEELEKIAPGLELTVDYGMLTIFSKPIFQLMLWIHDLVGNWGWSIILLTILIKAAFYKLSETSYKSMANMRKLTPRMQALKDQYGDDKQRLNQAMMEMYKKEKINPLGGCLPILVQIPVFIALYWVLLESVEMRQAPFIFWIKDLSIKDPYFVLPLIMGVSMYIQQKLNPQPPDPMQAKMMMMLPFVFTIFFAFFPAGLVVYWVVNNILSIAQQWYITQKIEGATAKR